MAEKKRNTVYSGGRPPRNSNGNTRPTNKANTTAARRKAARARKKRNRLIVFFILEILVLLLLFIVWWGLNKVDKMQKVEIDPEDPIIKIDDNIANNEAISKGYRNIALFGVDSRNKELFKGTRTDTIIIASINQSTGEVKMVSVLRDTYLNLSDGKYAKCNGAYNGGPKKAIAMLNMNLNLNITDFVTVGFEGVEKGIDMLGGIEIDVKEEEIVHLNNYQISMVGKEDGTLNAKGEPNFSAVPYVEYTPVVSAGRQNLNGLQALAYARIRYVGDDYERTNRQRTVIAKCLEKAKTISPMKLNAIAEEVFPACATSLDMADIVSLIAGVTKYSIGENTHFPFEGHFANKSIPGAGSCIVPKSLEDNVRLLHQFFFNESDYVPSEDVKTCSDKIKANTSVY